MQNQPTAGGFRNPTSEDTARNYQPRAGSQGQGTADGGALGAAEKEAPVAEEAQELGRGERAERAVTGPGPHQRGRCNAVSFLHSWAGSSQSRRVLCSTSGVRADLHGLEDSTVRQAVFMNLYVYIFILWRRRILPRSSQCCKAGPDGPVRRLKLSVRGRPLQKNTNGLPGVLANHRTQGHR